MTTSGTPRATATQETPEAFLFREAALLDDGRLQEWLGLLDPEIDYRVPVRTVPGDPGDSGFSSTAFFYQEDAASLAARVARLGTEEAWCEHPPTRTRRFVANVRVDSGEDDVVAVRNNLAVFCYRGDSPHPVILSGERHDTLHSHEGSWRLATRTVYLDSTVVGLQSLSVFL
jgi:3-phenylpropionate/cinnamic acid dioxygenase small subunit